MRSLWVIMVLAQFVFTPVLCGSDAPESKMDPPPKPAKLNNDGEYKAKMDKILEMPPSANDSAQERWAFLWKADQAASLAREYEKAESFARRITTWAPKDSFAWANLSVDLGKQGKYRDAAEAAQKAIVLDPSNKHAEMLLASWEWHLGQREQARKRFEAIVPGEKAIEKRTYYGCMACFYASVGEEAKVAEAIKKVKELKTDDDMGFFQRDIIFDPYRGKPWFIELVGKTLAGESEAER